MTGIALSVDLSDVEGGLCRLFDAMGDLKPMLDSIGETVAKNARHRFETGKGPGGEKWEPSTSAWAGGTTLVGRGHLRDSVNHVVSGNEVTVGSNVDYAAIHQFGGKIEPKNGKYLVFQVGGAWAKVSSVTLPARPYLGLEPDDEQAITDIVEDYLQLALQGGRA